MKWEGIDRLAKELNRKSEADFEKVRNKSLLQMRDRAVKTRVPTMGGTPVDTSELRLSAGVNLNRGEMGYTKDYAPHVEFGHRQEVGRYVPAIKRRLVQPYVHGQYFLRNNLRIQERYYRKDLTEELNKD